MTRSHPVRFVLLAAGLAVLLHVLAILAMARIDLGPGGAASAQRPVEVSLLPRDVRLVEPASEPTGQADRLRASLGHPRCLFDGRPNRPSRLQQHPTESPLITQTAPSPGRSGCGHH